MHRHHLRQLRLAFAVGSVMILLFAFQNCGRSDMLTSVGLEAGVTYNKVEASQFRTVVMNDFYRNRSLDVDVDSGVVLTSDNQRFCLGQLDRQQLQDILRLAQVCEPLNKPARPDMVCTMIYKLPYAELRSSSQVYKLGEKRDGCDVPVDLCGESALEFKMFIDGVMSRIEGMSCS